LFGQGVASPEFSDQPAALVGNPELPAFHGTQFSVELQPERYFTESGDESRGQGDDLKLGRGFHFDGIVNVIHFFFLAEHGQLDLLVLQRKEHLTRERTLGRIELGLRIAGIDNDFIDTRIRVLPGQEGAALFKGGGFGDQLHTV